MVCGAHCMIINPRIKLLSPRLYQAVKWLHFWGKTAGNIISFFSNVTYDAMIQFQQSTEPNQLIETEQI